MTDSRFAAWQARYPNLFKRYPVCGFDHPQGWDTLVHCLCAVLESHISRMPEDDRVSCDQTKEKFGGLRFYMNGQDEFISGAIALAEDMSFHICDTCGNPGQRRSGGWIRTLCDECQAKR